MLYLISKSYLVIYLHKICLKYTIHILDTMYNHYLNLKMDSCCTFCPMDRLFKKFHARWCPMCMNTSREPPVDLPWTFRVPPWTSHGPLIYPRRHSDVTPNSEMMQCISALASAPSRPPNPTLTPKNQASS